MNSKSYKRIIGLFIFALTVILFSIENVYADTCSDTEKKMDDNDTALVRYALSIKFDKDIDKYVITSDFKDSETGEELRKFDKTFKAGKIKFKVAGLYFYTPGTDEKTRLRKADPATVEDASSKINELKSGGTISELSLYSNDKITISSNVFSVRRDAKKYGVAIKLVPDGFDDPELASACKGKQTSFYVVVYTSLESGKRIDGYTYPISYNVVNSTSYGRIDCNGYQNKYDKYSFNYNFCEDKVAAVGVDGTEKKTGTRKFVIKEYTKGSMIKYEDGINGNKYSAGDALPFKCDYNDLVTGVSLDDSKYYVNKKYLYGEGTMKISLDNGYRFTGDYYDTTAKLNASCELKCEEVVKVEYGPPVASKAGLCFEYKVKVTSRVNCEMVTPPNKPPEQVVCTPTPWCNHPGGYADHQGGPSEEFDKCVVKCDGGKYSDKCVNKCYKQVYGKSVVRRTTGHEIAYNDKLVSKSLDVPYEFKYEDGIVIWDVGGDYGRYNDDGSTVTYSTPYKGGAESVITDSYWHRHSDWGYPGSVYVQYDKTGIPLIANCSTTYCWWEDNDSDACLDDSKLRYLNDPGVYVNRADGKDYSGQSDIELDAKYNKEKYETLVKQCEAYASCNTTTAEFTISVDYTLKGNKTKQTIYFPYTSNNDTNSKNTITSKDKSATCPTDSNSIILNSDGCYNCANIDQKRMYMTEWSFPGTWIHNKTGEITYDSSKATNKGWQSQPNKFCLPLNIENVNAKWYNYYQAKVNGNNKNISYNNKTYEVTCPDGTKLTNLDCDYRNTTFTSRDKIDYNINAKARKFGFFEWDIDISCFYALNSEFPSLSEKECKQTCLPQATPNEGADYVIRPVDLENLFPDSEGNKLSSTDKTGRTPGFNWSSYSNQTNKDVNYKSLPANYTKWIQAKGYSVYSDEYLDYEVNLTKEMITKIRNKKVNYTSWKGVVNDESLVEVKSANTYQSDLIRKDLAGYTKYPNYEALKCNNIGAHTPSAGYSAKCEDFTGEVK